MDTRKSRETASSESEPADNQDITVLCGSSAYSRKYYFNDQFDGLPENIKKQLNILCVLYTEDIGGTFQIYFDEDGHIDMMTSAEEDDSLYDEIGSVLKIKQYGRENHELFEQLEEYYRTFFIKK